jgi:acetyl esterase
MSILSHPSAAALAARAFQGAVQLSGRPDALAARRFRSFPGDRTELTVPTSVAPARIVVYRPAASQTPPPVHVNLHGGGYVLPLTELDDPLCRYLAARAGSVVVNVDYVLAPQYRFPAAPRQCFEVVRWVAEHGAEHGWDGGRLSVGGQSAGGGLAAAVARQALEQGGPEIALQVLHYPHLDLATDGRSKHSCAPKPALRPWMSELFDNAYAPDPTVRGDRLASPGNPADTADLAGIAPALVITAQHDLLRAEGLRYAERLRAAEALVGHVDLPGMDHGYDVDDGSKALETYALIARHLRQCANGPR